MKHIVKLTRDSMAGGDEWEKLVFELDPTADPGKLVAVEMTVDTVFFVITT